uniref:Cation efflux system protein, AcrB/AcrD/AcrF family protein n=1 Tax=uncultured Planctomycetota bacterium TaxID=120965 RepID=H5S888_9BACT|nr:cation efflux system protein, AcrB/AcrD/AcrF family protein [uncultured Planctomycetota bacterium]
MFQWIITAALRNRQLILLLALVLAVLGGYLWFTAAVDVFPDLNRPTVPVVVEYPGRAPEEVEQDVTRPLCAALQGAPHVLQVIGASSQGVSAIEVIFDWGTDPLVCQQIVSQRVPSARLPQDAVVNVLPPSAILNDVFILALRSRRDVRDPKDLLALQLQLRLLAEWEIRPRLFVPGVANVFVIGGLVRQYQVLTDPERLALHHITLEDLTQAVAQAFVATGGGPFLEAQSEKTTRITGPIRRPQDLEQIAIPRRDGSLVRLREVADVVIAGPIPRGSAAFHSRTYSPDGSVLVNNSPAVILEVQRQPGANVLELTQRVEGILQGLQEELSRTYPDWELQLESNIFRQATFIETAIHNVQESLRDGLVLVAIVLVLFLANVRTAALTLVALPLSLALFALIFGFRNGSWKLVINTMTLGGLAIAVGELVDDAIVDVENIYRRLKENRQLPQPRPVLDVVRDASQEIRSSIVYATFIVCLVVAPLLLLPGFSGAMFAPMGLAYAASLLASLFISLTVTPALASYLLPEARILGKPGDSPVVRCLKAAVRPLVMAAVRRPRWVLSFVGVLVVLALAVLPFLSGSFLPPFNEDNLVITVTAPLGVNLDEAARIGDRVAQCLLEVPEVQTITRFTGRAEQDEEVAPINLSHVHVRLNPTRQPKKGFWYACLRWVPILDRFAYQRIGRPREEVLADIRERLAYFPGVAINMGGPIAHQIDHILAGTEAAVAILVYGPDSATLRRLGEEILSRLREVPGAVDPRPAQPWEEMDQIRIRVHQQLAGQYGRSAREIAELLETALAGRRLRYIPEGNARTALVVWYTPEARRNLDSLRQTFVDTPAGRVPLEQLADVEYVSGPFSLYLEKQQRRIMVACNIASNDMTGVVEEIKRRLADLPLPAGYSLEYRGQYEERETAGTYIWFLYPLVLLAIVTLLWRCLGSWRAAFLVMTNVPLACVGAILTLLLLHPPTWQELAQHHWSEWLGLWFEKTSLSLAHWIGFITLTGIVSRNGIMMISHYIHLMRYEGESFDEKMILRGTLERLVPMLMTALTTILGLTPLLLGAGEPGREILHPLAVVVASGLLWATLLDQIVTPALFFLFGRKVYATIAPDKNAASLSPVPQESSAATPTASTGKEPAPSPAQTLGIATESTSSASATPSSTPIPDGQAQPVSASPHPASQLPSASPDKPQLSPTASAPSSKSP